MRSTKHYRATTIGTLTTRQPIQSSTKYCPLASIGTDLAPARRSLVIDDHKTVSSDMPTRTEK